MPGSMSCLGCDPANIYLYAAVCGLFTGAAGARLVRGPVRRTRAEPRGKGISALVPLYGTLVILSALGGFFFGGGYPGPVVFIPFGALALFALLVGLFRRAAGIPVFILSAALLLYIGFALRTWSCVSPGEELLRLELLSGGETDLRVQVDIPGGQPRVVQNDGSEITIHAEVLQVHRAWFFIKDAHFFRASVLEPLPEYDGRLLVLPGFTRESYTSEAFAPERFIDYILRYDNQKGFTLKMNGSADS